MIGRYLEWVSGNPTPQETMEWLNALSVDERQLLFAEGMGLISGLSKSGNEEIERVMASILEIHRGD